MKADRTDDASIDQLPDVEGDSLLKVFGKHGGQDG